MYFGGHCNVNFNLEGWNLGKCMCLERACKSWEVLTLDYFILGPPVQFPSLGPLVKPHLISQTNRIPIREGEIIRVRYPC
jgi:hypothetical protein